MKTFIIAEAGINHNGDIKTAEKLIDAAVIASADAVKFQTFKTEKLVSKFADKAKYQIKNTGTDESQFGMLKKFELSHAEFIKLSVYAGKKGIIFMSTPFDEESADFLDSINMKIFKIPSGEITNKPLIQYIASKNKPIILSTGMSYLGEVEKAVNWIKQVKGYKSSLSLLHCVSSYPAEMEDINLSAMKTLETVFKLPVGYSDHSMGIEIPVAAAAMGAKIIEKHFTLNRGMKGPDHKASLEPVELKKMIEAIRNVEKAIGDGVKKPVINEKNTRNIARKSVVLIKDINDGDVIKLSNLAIKRPGTGISPEFIEIIAGMRAKRDIHADTVLKWEDLKNA